MKGNVRDERWREAECKEAKIGDDDGIVLQNLK